MDFSIIPKLFLEQLIRFWPYALLMFVLFLFRLPFVKGVIGEMWVNLMLRMRLDKKRYHLYKNVTLELDGGTTQIDHVLLSPFGIFVIETKNMKGWIFGSKKQKTWTQKIYRHSSKFMNPLHQNYKHILALGQCLNLPKESLISLVVFAGDAEFKTPMPENVTYLSGMIKFIKAKSAIVFSDAEVTELKLLLETGRLKPSFKTHRTHVKHVKSIIEAKRTETKNINMQKTKV